VSTLRLSRTFAFYFRHRVVRLYDDFEAPRNGLDWSQAETLVSGSDEISIVTLVAELADGTLFYLSDSFC
jgi:hypothetical protein